MIGPPAAPRPASSTRPAVSRRESSRLITVGLLAASPTAAAGWADYSDGHEEQQRVGLVHAATNIAALTCYAAALLHRRRGSGGGRLLSVAGGLLGGLGAALGGHLSFRQTSGANHAEDVPHVGPGDWRQVGVLTEPPVRTPVRRMVGSRSVTGPSGTERPPPRCLASRPGWSAGCCTPAALGREPVAHLDPLGVDVVQQPLDSCSYRRTRLAGRKIAERRRGAARGATGRVPPSACTSSQIMAHGLRG